MTIAELLARIGLAFERTSPLVAKGAFGDVMLSDVGIVVVISFVVVGAYAWFYSRP